MKLLLIALLFCIGCETYPKILTEKNSVIVRHEDGTFVTNYGKEVKGVTDIEDSSHNNMGLQYHFNWGK